MGDLDENINTGNINNELLSIGERLYGQTDGIKTQQILTFEKLEAG